MATTYQKIAKAALINWNGLSEEEATIKIQTESVQELEKQVNAMNSIKYAVIGIATQISLTNDETTNFFDAIINGPENAEIFNSIKQKIQTFTEEQKLNVLSTIHDGWVIKYSDKETFNKKVNKQQLRQYAPLDLIGWNEVKSDLLFLKPILETIRIQVNEETLQDVYHTRVSNYMEKYQINSQEDLNALIKQGKNYYPILPKELEERLQPMSHTVSEQIIHNWNTKDKKSAELFTKRQQTHKF